MLDCGRRTADGFFVETDFAEELFPVWASFDCFATPLLLTFCFADDLAERVEGVGGAAFCFCSFTADFFAADLVAAFDDFSMIFFDDLFDDFFDDLAAGDFNRLVATSNLLRANSRLGLMVDSSRGKEHW